MVLAGERSKMLKVFCPICGKVYKNPYIASCGVCTYAHSIILFSEKCACCGADSSSEDGRGEGHRVNTVIDPLHSLTLLFFEHTCIVSVEWAYL